jgi:hypothetical protein
LMDSSVSLPQATPQSDSGTSKQDKRSGHLERHVPCQLHVKEHWVTWNMPERRVLRPEIILQACGKDYDCACCLLSSLE